MLFVDSYQTGIYDQVKKQINQLIFLEQIEHVLLANNWPDI